MYQLAVYLHILAAITWIGGMVFLAAVLVPITRTLSEPPGAGARVLSGAARRFRVVAWIAIAVLIGTGIWILVERSVSPSDLVSGDGEFLRDLRIKLGFVVAVVVLSALHDFILGPRVAEAMRRVRTEGARGLNPGPRGRGLAETDEASRSWVQRRKALTWLARLNVLLALVVVAIAVALVRGFPF